MLTRRFLYKNDLLSIRHVSCCDAPKELSEVEYSDADTLIFPIRGIFMEHFSPGYRVLAEPNVALLFPSGRSYKVSHPVNDSDECLVLEFSPDCFDEALATTSRGLTRSTIGTHYTLTPSTMACRHILWHRLERQFLGPLEIE